MKWIRYAGYINFYEYHKRYDSETLLRGFKGHIIGINKTFGEDLRSHNGTKLPKFGSGAVVIYYWGRVGY